MTDAEHRLTLGALFTEYESEIRLIFERIAHEVGSVGERAATLEFTETTTLMLFRSVPTKRRVLADWRGIASLWAMSQAVGRLSPAMFNARRTGATRLDLPDGSPEALGYEFIRYAQELCAPQKWRWNTYFPTPDRNTSSYEAKAGDTFFFRSLEWILRHELAHIAFNYSDTPLTVDQSRAEEREADLLATRALKESCRRSRPCARCQTVGKRTCARASRISCRHRTHLGWPLRGGRDDLKRAISTDFGSDFPLP